MSLSNANIFEIDPKVKDWINKKIDLLKKGQSISVNGVEILNICELATALKKEFAAYDEQDNSLTPVFGRMNGCIMTEQLAKDEEIIFKTTSKLLAPFEIFILEDIRINDIEESDANDWGWNRSAAGF